MKASIIGGGNSLRGFDLEQIDGFRIAINKAANYIDYDIVVAIDHPDILKKHGIPFDNLHTQTKYGVGRGWTLTGTRQIVRHPERIGNFNGSLFAAINIALNLGFNEIEVYGADGKIGDDGLIHFYDNEPAPPELLTHYKDAFQRFNGFKNAINSQLLKTETIKWIIAP